MEGGDRMMTSSGMVVHLDYSLCLFYLKVKNDGWFQKIVKLYAKAYITCKGF